MLFMCMCVCVRTGVCVHISDTIMHFDILAAQENKKDKIYFWL